VNNGSSIPGSVGVPVNSKVHIVDDTGKELPAGKVGAVYFSDGLQSFEYFNDPEKDARSIQ